MSDTLRLLVIEDEAADFLLMQRELRRQEPEASLTWVSRQDHLCAALDAGGWDVILSDYSVPGMDFLQTLKLITSRRPMVPVILVSGTIGEEEAVELLKQGAWDFVLKSRLSRLSTVIRRSLREAREHQARIAAEEALSQREALLNAFFSASPVGMVVLDTDFRHLRINDALARIIGAPTESHLGRTVGEVVPVLAPELLAMLESIVLTGQPILNVEMSGELPSASGMLRHWLISHFPILDGAGGVAAIGGVVTEISERKRVEETLKKSEQRAQALLAENRRLTQRTFKLLEQERRHLARELHDELGQWLAAIQAEAESLRLGRSTGQDAQALASAQAISESAAEVNRVIRRLVGELRPALLDSLGLADSLRDMVSQWQKHRPGVRCELFLEDGLEGMGESLNITAYRIVQEGLTNVAKHAQASRVRISLRRVTDEQGAALILFLENDGKPLSPGDAHRGMGLLGMRERAAAVGGEFDLSSPPGGGVRIEARLPIANRPQEDE
ncbi:MAG: PAS domain-containing protein [Rhodocyclaceae bacterium]|nr:PAS domain-containing protein [Rhodocyclaceae bacterium]